MFTCRTLVVQPWAVGVTGNCLESKRDEIEAALRKKKGMWLLQRYAGGQHWSWNSILFHGC